MEISFILKIMLLLVPITNNLDSLKKHFKLIKILDSQLRLRETQRLSTHQQTTFSRFPQLQ